eukprot:scaffold38245_cov33-Tisochrysis_lutea.AAC.1
MPEQTLPQLYFLRRRRTARVACRRVMRTGESQRASGRRASSGHLHHQEYIASRATALTGAQAAVGSPA